MVKWNVSMNYKPDSAGQQIALFIFNKLMALTQTVTCDPQFRASSRVRSRTQPHEIKEEQIKTEGLQLLLDMRRLSSP